MNAAVARMVVEAGAQRAEVVHFEHGPDKQRDHSIEVVLEPGSYLELQEMHSGQGADRVKLRVDVELAEGAQMRHVAVLDDHGMGRFTTQRRIRLAEDAKLEYTRIGAGAAGDFETVQASMDGRGAQFRHGALLLVKAGRQAELDIELQHEARGARSESLCRCIVSANASGRFAGRILIAPEAQGSDAQLRNDNLLLDESARMETRPELEVYADEVQCAHGAATGALDEAALFYLRTRGLPPGLARATLVRAFASRIINAIDLAEAQGMAGAILDGALSDSGPLELAA
ncbi:SufD family Fe-S cluster assembly protein [Candidatus Foliamicus sp.]